MNEERRTGMYLLFASVVSVFSALLILITIAMSWESWMVPLIFIGCFVVWMVHITRIGSEVLYENICAGLLMGEFFFFGVHRISLYDMAIVACIILIVLSVLDRKRLLYMTAALYVFGLLYHFLCLHTITHTMEREDMVHLVLGIVAVAGATQITRYKIGKRQEARETFTDAFVQLETAGRQNAVFLSNVSHELRTPINMVLGISEVVLEKDISPEIRADLQSIQMAGKRLSSQISNMLDYTEIVEGTLTPVKEEYMITSVLNDVIATTALQSGKSQLEMVFDINPEIPAVLIGDAEKISHVLKILLENSIKFTEEGGINVCIEFRREDYGINLVIDIHDTGIGMTDSQLLQMYDDFYQADSGSSRFAGGLGLGLPIARGLLHAMGGFIRFESEEQQGLHAHIIIPQGVADDMPSMAVSDPERLCIACYFRPEKYSGDEVREYYDKLILHLVEGLGLEGYQAHNFEGLLKLQRTYQLTHVFIAQAQYEEKRSYYEELANTLQVVVIADQNFILDEDSRLLVIRKPFFALSVVNLLNGEVRENGFEEAQAAGRKPFSCVGVRVLVVDDEEMNLVVAKGVLGSYGMQVDTCLNGKAAVERCADITYDIVFLDHMMPGFDGVQTLKRIREINNGAYQDSPIIALTANTISGAREMFKNEGFTEFVPKPIDRAVLERVLRRVLPGHCIRYGMGREVATEAPEGKGSPLDAKAPEGGGSPLDAKAPEDGDGRQEALVTLNVPEPGGAEPVAESSLPYASLVQVGINVKMGLDYCCGEEDFYLEMLQTFHSQGAEKKAEIVALYEAENWTDYAIKVHALKSTSLTIGAERLSEQAKALEQAGKSGDVEYVRRNHPALLRSYEEVCESIAAL